MKIIFTQAEQIYFSNLLFNLTKSIKTRAYRRYFIRIRNKFLPPRTFSDFNKKEQNFLDSLITDGLISLKVEQEKNILEQAEYINKAIELLMSIKSKLKGDK